MGRKISHLEQQLQAKTDALSRRQLLQQIRGCIREEILRWQWA